MRILVLNGPNLNLLGTREPEIYGYETLGDIERIIQEHAEPKGIELAFHQTNREGEIIEAIHAHRDWDGIVLNPGAYTHTSIAIADAVSAVQAPVVEVHLSNVHAREEFRRHSYISPVTRGQVVGFGWRGYLAAVDLLYGAWRAAQGQGGTP